MKNSFFEKCHLSTFATTCFNSIQTRKGEKSITCRCKFYEYNCTIWIEVSYYVVKLGSFEEKNIPIKVSTCSFAFPVSVFHTWWRLRLALFIAEHQAGKL